MADAGDIVCKECASGGALNNRSNGGASLQLCRRPTLIRSPTGTQVHRLEQLFWREPLGAAPTSENSQVAISFDVDGHHVDGPRALSDSP